MHFNLELKKKNKIEFKIIHFTFLNFLRLYKNISLLKNRSFV